ncbi:hypothetical protein PoB_003369600 [Plakobranchus ocellatus]|uniref:Uncharacterized protein n=1 Tax=Plakobranchus ocellatus TaxID=259542 RepID=A0AAV4AFV6_9GAST|nr:hypothetical protein PoB_003369600 [Plakobranchus ocellatus]
MPRMLDEDLLDLLYMRATEPPPPPPPMGGDTGLDMEDTDDPTLADWAAELDQADRLVFDEPLPFPYAERYEFFRKLPRLDLHLWKWIIFAIAFAISL